MKDTIKKICYFMKITQWKTDFFHSIIFFLMLMNYLDCSHSDNNLLELEKETSREDNRAVLLEGGLTRTASAKFHSSSVKLNLIRLIAISCSILIEFYLDYLNFCYHLQLLVYRFITMDDSFLLENRPTLRAMWVYYIVDGDTQSMLILESSWIFTYKFM